MKGSQNLVVLHLICYGFVVLVEVGEGNPIFRGYVTGKMKRGTVMPFHRIVALLLWYYAKT